MRMGVLLSEEYSDKLLELCSYMGVEPYDFLCKSIDVMYNELNKDAQDEEQR